MNVCSLVKGDYRRDVSYVDCLAVLKSSELRFNRFDLLSLLLVHNTGLQDFERLWDGAHSRVTLHTLI